jgi:hypothetical protein
MYELSDNIPEIEGIGSRALEKIYELRFGKNEISRKEVEKQFPNATSSRLRTWEGKIQLLKDKKNGFLPPIEPGRGRAEVYTPYIIQYILDHIESADHKNSATYERIETLFKDAKREENITNGFNRLTPITLPCRKTTDKFIEEHLPDKTNKPSVINAHRKDNIDDIRNILSNAVAMKVALRLDDDAIEGNLGGKVLHNNIHNIDCVKHLLGGTINMPIYDTKGSKELNKKFHRSMSRLKLDGEGQERVVQTMYSAGSHGSLDSVFHIIKDYNVTDFSCTLFSREGGYLSYIELAPATLSKKKCQLLQTT